MRTDDETLVAAMAVLARDVQCDDGVANAAIHEAALRIKELSASIGAIRSEVVELTEKLEEARKSVGLTKDNEAVRALRAVMAIIDRHDGRVVKPCV